MRRASIDRVNQKYLGIGSRGYGTAPYIGTPIYNTSNVVHIGAPIIQNGLTRSIVNPPVYQIVEHQPVIETITTPGKVYQIITPIVQVPSPVYHPRRQRCPWWCWMLLGLLFLALLLIGLSYLFREELGFVAVGTQEKNDPSIPNAINIDNTIEKCKQGQHLVNGKCIACPQGSSWNGTKCIKNNDSETQNKTNEPTNETFVSKNEIKNHLKFYSESLWT